MQNRQLLPACFGGGLRKSGQEQAKGSVTACASSSEEVLLKEDVLEQPAKIQRQQVGHPSKGQVARYSHKIITVRGEFSDLLQQPDQKVKSRYLRAQPHNPCPGPTLAPAAYPTCRWFQCQWPWLALTTRGSYRELLNVLNGSCSALKLQICKDTHLTGIAIFNACIPIS